MMLRDLAGRAHVHALWLAASCALSLLACSSETSVAPTQIVVTVDSDLAVPGEIDTVRIQVVGNGESEPADADLRSQGLPRTLGLVHESGALGPITIRASGLLNGVAVIEKELVTSFVEHTTSLLTIELESACKGLFCQEGLTCENGSCVDTPVVDPGSDQPGDDAGSMPDPDDDAGAGEPGPDGGEPAGDAATGDPGDAPGCTIELPAEGDAYQIGKKLALMGSCTDPETGALTSGLSWTSDLDGTLAAGGSAQGTLTSAGDHELKLCALDPVDPGVSGCATVTIKATTSAQPAAAITSISQRQSSADPFDPNAEISFVGEGSGAGVTLTWIDSVQGAIGEGNEQALASPLVGRHKVELIVTDRNGVSASVSDEFLVLANNQTVLVQTFTTANETLDTAGGSAVAQLAVDTSGRAYAASAQGLLYTFDPGDDKSDASIALNKPPLRGLVQGLDFAESSGLVYLATVDGLTVCSYLALTGINGLSCTSYTGEDLPSDDVRSVLRMRGSDNKDHLIVGTSEGLLLAGNLSGDNKGSVKLEGRKINAMTPGDNVAWLATDNGLYRFNPDTEQVIPIGGIGAPMGELTDVALDGAGDVWVSSGSGLARFSTGESKWRRFGTDDGLASNQVNAVAVARVSVDGKPRDVVWAATDAGLSRLDPGYGSFVRFGMADGLPSAKVLDLLVLADGTKLIGTDAGIALYDGL